MVVGEDAVAKGRRVVDPQKEVDKRVVRTDELWNK